MKKKLLILVILSLMVLSFIPVRMITTSDESFVVSAHADIEDVPLCWLCMGPYGDEWCEYAEVGTIGAQTICYVIAGDCILGGSSCE